MTWETSEPSSELPTQRRHRTPTSIARRQRILEEEVREERLEITDPVLERHALRIGWELTERSAPRGRTSVKFVVARAIYRVIELDEDEDGEPVFILTRRKRPADVADDLRCEERPFWARRRWPCADDEPLSCR